MQETVDVGSYTVDIEPAGIGGEEVATDYGEGEEASGVEIELGSASDLGSDIDLVAEENEDGDSGGGGEGKVVAVAGVVGIEAGSEPAGYEVIVDEDAGTITVIRLDYPNEGWEEELHVAVLIDPLKRLDAHEKARRKEALTWYKSKMAVLQAEAAREWRRQPLGKKTVPGLNGICGPWDGEQCSSCWRYQQALERDASHTQWRDTSAGRRTLHAERRHRMTVGYTAARLEPRQTPAKVVRARRSRHDKRAAFALQRRASRKHPMEQLQAVADQLLQLSGRVRKRSSDALTGGPQWVWKDRWLQLIELPQGREAVGKPHKHGAPHMRPKPALALEYRHHSNSKRVLGVVPLSDKHSGYRLVLKTGPRGDRMLDLHAAHIPRDVVAYSAFPGFVVCGPRDHRTLKRGKPAVSTQRQSTVATM